LRRLKDAVCFLSYCMYRVSILIMTVLRRQKNFEPSRKLTTPSSVMGRCSNGFRVQRSMQVTLQSNLRCCRTSEFREPSHDSLLCDLRYCSSSEFRNPCIFFFSATCNAAT
jgi:hypothetical protein